MSQPTAAQKSTRDHGSANRETRARKIFITVDARVLREVERLAERTGRTLSAHITDALARDLRHRALERLIEEHEREHGVITEGELAQVRRRWQD